MSQINAKSLPRFSKSLIVERMSLSVKVKINQDTLKSKSTLELTGSSRDLHILNVWLICLFLQLGKHSFHVSLTGFYLTFKMLLLD